MDVGDSSPRVILTPAPAGERVDEYEDFIEWLANAAPAEEKAIRGEIDRYFAQPGDKDAVEALNLALTEVLKPEVDRRRREQILDRIEPFTRSDPEEAVTYGRDPVTGALLLSFERAADLMSPLYSRPDLHYVRAELGEQKFSLEPVKRLSTRNRGPWYRRLLGGRKVDRIELSCYLRKGRIYIPTQARTKAGYWTGVDPVEVVPADDAVLIRAAFHRTLSRGNPRVSTPLRRDPPVFSMLSLAGVKSWVAFEKGAHHWRLTRIDRDWTIHVLKKAPRGWESDETLDITFPPGTDFDAVIDWLIMAMKQAELDPPGSWFFYVRDGMVYIPTTASIGGNGFLDVDPVDRVALVDGGAVRSAVLDTIARGNPKIAAPDRSDEPPIAVVKAGSFPTWASFERTASVWCFGHRANGWQLIPYRRDRQGVLVADKDRATRLDGERDAAVDYMVAILQRPTMQSSI